MCKVELTYGWASQLISKDFEWYRGMFLYSRLEIERYQVTHPIIGSISKYTLDSDLDIETISKDTLDMIWISKRYRRTPWIVIWISNDTEWHYQ